MQEDGLLKIPTLAKSLLLAAIFSFGPTIGNAVADTAVGQAASTAGDQLITQINSTLANTTSLSSDIQEIDSYPGQYKDLKQSGHISISRPGKLKIEIQRYRRIDATQPWGPSGNNTLSDSDGATYWFAFLHPHSTQVRHSAATSGALRTAISGLPPLQGFFGNSAGSTLPGQDGSASIGAPVTWLGASYRTIDYQVAGRSDDDLDAVAYVGDDNVIHRLVYTTSNENGKIIKDWQLTNVRVNDNPPDSQFAYTPPKNSIPLDTSVAVPTLDSGAIAPDFAVADRNGIPVHLADYRGQTVILDFWATWCWPCNQSLPQTEKVAASYRGKKVVVLAVAIRDSKAGFGAWLKRHSYPDINFVIDQQPQGKDIASTLYGVVTTPTAFVIDPDGKLVQSIVGYSGPSEQLAKAVNLAVSQKATASAVP
jgi:peroxiredoxin